VAAGATSPVERVVSRRARGSSSTLALHLLQQHAIQVLGGRGVALRRGAAHAPHRKVGGRLGHNEGVVQQRVDEVRVQPRRRLQLRRLHSLVLLLLLLLVVVVMGVGVLRVLQRVRMTADSTRRADGLRGRMDGPLHLWLRVCVRSMQHVRMGGRVACLCMHGMHRVRGVRGVMIP
jgi:hypothetical protein